MKKILLVLAIAFIGCSQPDNLPGPIDPVDPVEVVTQTVPNSHNFEGAWNCDDWVVDDIMGTTHRRKISFYNQENGVSSISINEYTSGGSLIQLVTMSTAYIDSNYFDNPLNPHPIKFKGVMITDSTLMVYEYYTSGLGVDTSQVKEFVKQ